MLLSALQFLPGDAIFSIGSFLRYHEAVTAADTLHRNFVQSCAKETAKLHSHAQHSKPDHIFRIHLECAAVKMCCLCHTHFAGQFSSVGVYAHPHCIERRTIRSYELCVNLPVDTSLRVEVSGYTRSRGYWTYQAFWLKDDGAIPARCTCAGETSMSQSIRSSFTAKTARAIIDNGFAANLDSCTPALLRAARIELKKMFGFRSIKELMDIANRVGVHYTINMHRIEHRAILNQFKTKILMLKQSDSPDVIKQHYNVVSEIRLAATSFFTRKYFVEGGSGRYDGELTLVGMMRFHLEPKIRKMKPEYFSRSILISRLVRFGVDMEARDAIFMFLPVLREIHKRHKAEQLRKEEEEQRQSLKLQLAAARKRKYDAETEVRDRRKRLKCEFGYRTIATFNQALKVLKINDAHMLMVDKVKLMIFCECEDVGVLRRHFALMQTIRESAIKFFAKQFRVANFHEVQFMGYKGEMVLPGIAQFAHRWFRMDQSAERDRRDCKCVQCNINLFALQCKFRLCAKCCLGCERHFERHK